jgi:L-rhamnose mutarotase
MQRFGAVVRLRPERRSEYLALHGAVWPEVEAMLISANIRNYTIFCHDDLLFGYYEYVGDDYAADQTRIALDPVTQQWWSLTEPCQQRLPDSPGGGPWLTMSQIWHLD